MVIPSWGYAVLRIRTRFHIFVGVACSVAIAVAVIAIHIRINYPPQVREVVQFRAITATILLSALMTTVIFGQLRKTYLLTLKLQQLVDRDRLTDVATRDYFFHHMRQMSARPGVSLMVDIDNFKQINDTHGHLVGDSVIRKVAEVLKENTRSEDIVCRFGGEEYVIFLAGRTPEEAFKVAERMRQAVDGMRIDANGVPIKATISIGGSRKHTATDIENAIRAADAALYRAKEGGRNRTMFAA